MPWVVTVLKNGVPSAGVEPFDAVLSAIQAGNSALRNGAADDVTIANREHAAIYYQFSTVRTSSEEQRIARMLDDQSAKATPQG